ncbi:MAG: class I SAM-dependent methyltransferase [candidate division WOR-3 bacterium]
MPLESISCCFCDNNDTKVLYQIGDFKIVKCKNCGLVYTNPRLSCADLNQLYNDHYFRSQNPLTLGYENYLNDAENIIKTFQKRWALIERHLTTNGRRILDIGCAYGFLLNYLQKKGYETYGIELSKNAADYAIRNFKLKVFTKQLREIKFEDNYFDVITIWDVIEHFPNPKLELLEIKRILKPGGILSVITPDSGSFQARFWGGRWVEYLRPAEHLYFFSKKILIKKISELGFDVITIGTAGKFVSIRFVLDRLKAYNKFLFTAIEKIGSYLKINEKIFYVDPKDKMFINFRKR